MRITSRSEYGMRAMVYLAARAGGEPVPSSEIAAKEGIPAPFLERIMARLRTSGLVAATRGAAGGYRLARDARCISAADVINALEGPLALTGCVPDEGACRRSGDCASRRVWARLGAAIDRTLADMTLADLVAEADK